MTNDEYISLLRDIVRRAFVLREGYHHLSAARNRAACVFVLATDALRIAQEPTAYGAIRAAGAEAMQLAFMHEDGNGGDESLTDLFHKWNDGPADPVEERELLIAIAGRALFRASRLAPA